MIRYPLVETERLLLRGWRPEDFQAYAELLSDPDVATFIGGVQQPNDAWRNMATVIGHWAMRGYGFWAVERKADGAFIGRIGLWQPEGWPSLEVGWTLARAFWGHGYATEAARASLDYGFRNFAVERLISLIADDNVRSQAVAERIGETKGSAHDLRIFGRSYPVDVWSISRERWESGR